MRESEIEKYLVQRVKALGGEVRKVAWIGRRGAPDRLVMLPIPDSQMRQADYAEREAGFSDDVYMQRFLRQVAAALRRTMPTIWVELKATGKKPEPHQLREHKRMRAMGQRVVVIDSIEGVDALLA